MPNRLFYTVKLSSPLLKYYNNNYTATFEECLRSGLIISLSDSQMLKSIRDITNRHPDLNHLESLFIERDRIKRRKNSPSNRARLTQIQSEIYQIMYIPEYITVSMDSIQDYTTLYTSGLTFNGRQYVRMSCSASQARVSTIVFVDSSIHDELKKRLDNNRDLAHPLAPSKYNAYLGLYSSASLPVTRPRYCIIPDYIESRGIPVSWSIENPDWDKDDTLETRIISNEFNAFDGSGLISPTFAARWAEDLHLSYTPCNFCVRYAFTKGLVNEFDFVEWCHDENSDNYIITDIYGVQRDLREIDVILTEGMAKLYDSWSSQSDLDSSAISNGIDWRITKYAPEYDKDASTMNYQYLQTLNLPASVIPSLCQDTVSYIQGISYQNIYYTLLFLCGQSFDEEHLKNFLQSSDNYWLKCLILNHNLLNDKYSKEKIRDMIVGKIEQACLGRIITQSNYQAIIPDSYALMQHMFNLPVTGLLNSDEFYSQFWEKRNAPQIACARSPQMWRAEWPVMKNKYFATSPQEQSVIDKIHKYFKYNYNGIITNVHSDFTLRLAGSDFDYDIMFTTNNPEVIKGTYQDEIVTAYDVPKPKKKPNLTEDDLFNSDIFSFGQQIGPLTNIATSIYALLPLFPKDSPEYERLISRLKQCCVNQSKQIDKTKIGQDVKCIPKIWNQFQLSPIDPETGEVLSDPEIDFNNSILADRKPYFFRYNYKSLDKEYKDFIKNINENLSMIKDENNLASLIAMKELGAPLTEQEQSILDYYNKHIPVLDTDCEMNRICHYIESVDFNIKQKVKSSENFDYTLLTSPNFTLNSILYSQIKDLVTTTINSWQSNFNAQNLYKSFTARADENSHSQEKAFRYEALQNDLLTLCSNIETLANHLVYLFYVDKPSLNKSNLWKIAGEWIYENVKKRKFNSFNSFAIDFPIKDSNGSLKYLYENYQITNITITKEEEDG